MRLLAQVLLVAILVVTAAVPQANAALPNVDVRDGDRVPAFSAGERAAQRELRTEVGEEQADGRVVAGTGGVAITGIGEALTGPARGDAEGIALRYLRDNAVALGLRATDIDALRLKDSYTSWEGTTHLAWTQTAGGIDAYDNEIRVNVAQNGSVINAGGNALPGFEGDGQPRLGERDALTAAARDVGGDASSGSAELTLFGGADGSVLAWAVSTTGDDGDLYDVLIDADDGRRLARFARTDHAVDAKVHDWAPGLSPQKTVDIEPLLSTPVDATHLKGPNARAWSDTVDDCRVLTIFTLDTGCAGPGSAAEQVAPGSGNVELTAFPNPAQNCATGATIICTWDSTTGGSWETNRARGTVQTFYSVNRFHNHMVAPPIGFDSASRGFGGDDPVIVNTYDGAPSNGGGLPDGSHVNNANFATPADGISPVMQMYLFRGADRRSIHSGDDAGIVYHEYTHGLVKRLVGLVGLTDFQPRAMNEAWADWYSFDALVGDNLISDTPAPGEVMSGVYAYPAPFSESRTQPIDCTVGAPPAQCPGAGTAGTGGYTLGDLGKIATTSNFHWNGEIWAETLWDLRRALGTATTRRLVTDGMRLSPTQNPTFLDGRDAILAADVAAFGGANRDAIWQVFSGRGMGWSARVAGSDHEVTREAFDVPDTLEEVTTVVTDPVPGGDGDGFAEPGETVRVAVTLANTGSQAVTGVVGRLSSAQAFADDEPRGFGDASGLAAGSRSTVPFFLTLPPSTACAGAVPYAIDVSSASGVAATIAGTVRAESYPPRAVGLAVPDTPATPRVATIGVPAGGAVSDVDVGLDVSDVTVVDLTVQLTSPQGTTVTLADGPSIDQFQGTIFDDESLISIQDASDGASGRFAPEQPLSAFNGQASGGNWTLTVRDEIGTFGDATLNSWTLIAAGAGTCSTTVSPPLAETGGAGDVSQTGARLTGTIDPRGRATSYRFEYGPTAAYGQRTEVADAGAASGASGVSAAIGGLSPSADYHYRVAALVDGAVVARGADATFRTADPAAPPPPPLGGSLLPPVRTPADANITFARTAKTLIADSKGQFTFTFGGRAGTTGSTTFAASKKVLKLGKKSFKVDSKGIAKVKYKLSKSDLKKLKRKKSVKVTATVLSASGEKAKRTFTLKAPKAKKNRGG